jgi:hypothetical protein
MTQHTRIHDKFEYHVEDLDCDYCQFRKSKSKHHKYACREESCRFDSIRNKAIGKGRIKRKTR